jgi:ring-1,2-phenylacetyl-CoA epoxidase subunit PaaD
MVTPVLTDRAHLWKLAATVVDPEIPVLTIEDLGILRDVSVDDAGVVVTITPTYSGCPAMDAIRDDLLSVFRRKGIEDVAVRLVLSPAWTTDWMSEDGKRKLAEYGIAPPSGHSTVSDPTVTRGPISLTLATRCPRCGSADTVEISRFGSTSCKALYECRACLEPFDYFKVL